MRHAAGKKRIGQIENRLDGSQMLAKLLFCCAQTDPAGALHWFPADGVGSVVYLFGWSCVYSNHIFVLIYIYIYYKYIYLCIKATSIHLLFFTGNIFLLFDTSALWFNTDVKIGVFLTNIDGRFPRNRKFIGKPS